MNMREVRVALRELAETGQDLPNHEFRAKIAEIVKATEEIEENLDRQEENRFLEMRTERPE